MNEENCRAFCNYPSLEEQENDPATLAAMAVRRLAMPMLAVAVTILALSALAFAAADDLQHELPNLKLFENVIAFSAFSIFALAVALVLSWAVRLSISWWLRNLLQIRWRRWTLSGPMLFEAVSIGIGVGVFLGAVLTLGVWGLGCRQRSLSSRSFRRHEVLPAHIARLYRPGEY